MCSLLAFPGVSCLSDPHIYSTVQFSFILHSFHSFSSVLTDPFFNSMFSHHHMTFAFLPICCSILIFLSPSSIFSPSSHSSGFCLQFSLLQYPLFSILTHPFSPFHSQFPVLITPFYLLSLHFSMLSPPFSHSSVLTSPFALLYSHFSTLTSLFSFLTFLLSYFSIPVSPLSLTPSFSLCFTSHFSLFIHSYTLLPSQSSICTPPMSNLYSRSFVLIPSSSLFNFRHSPLLFSLFHSSLTSISQANNITALFLLHHFHYPLPATPFSADSSIVCA
jgi:hypothetical protein